MELVDYSSLQRAIQLAIAIEKSQKGPPPSLLNPRTIPRILNPALLNLPPSPTPLLIKPNSPLVVHLAPLRNIKSGVPIISPLPIQMLSVRGIRRSSIRRRHSSLMLRMQLLPLPLLIHLLLLLPPSPPFLSLASEERVDVERERVQ